MPKAVALAPGEDGLRLPHLHSFLANRPLWRCVIDEPFSFLPQFYFLLRSYNIMSLGQKGQSVCAYSTKRRVLAAATVCRWWQVLTEYDGSEGKYGVVFSGGGGEYWYASGDPPTDRQLGRCCLTMLMRSVRSACRRLERKLTPGSYGYALCRETIRWNERHPCLTLIRRISTLPLHNGGP